MRIPRKPKMTSGSGEAWFYITSKGLEIRVANTKGWIADHSFVITRDQLFRAVQVIKGEAK
jgi:hypothetical protein